MAFWAGSQWIWLTLLWCERNVGNLKYAHKILRCKKNEKDQGWSTVGKKKIPKMVT